MSEAAAQSVRDFAAMGLRIHALHGPQKPRNAQNPRSGTDSRRRPDCAGLLTRRLIIAPAAWRQNKARETLPPSFSKVGVFLPSAPAGLGGGGRGP